MDEVIKHLSFENTEYLRINDTYNDIKTNFLEKDIRILNILKDKGRKSYFKKESEIKNFLVLHRFTNKN